MKEGERKEEKRKKKRKSIIERKRGIWRKK
jgi:hypothetical protein